MSEASITVTAEGLLSHDLQRRDTLLESRQLQQAWPLDAGVRERLAGCLLSALNDAKEEKDLQRRDALLAELRQLQQAWPQDGAVRESMARVLLRSLIDTKEENDLRCRDELLVELRQLQQLGLRTRRSANQWQKAYSSRSSTPKRRTICGAVMRFWPNYASCRRPGLRMPRSANPWRTAYSKPLMTPKRRTTHSAVIHSWLNCASSSGPGPRTLPFANYCQRPLCGAHLRQRGEQPAAPGCASVGIASTPTDLA
jgi:hypothetical protein